MSPKARRGDAEGLCMAQKKLENPTPVNPREGAG